MKRRSATAELELSLDELKPMLPGGDLKVRGVTADAAAVKPGMLFVHATQSAQELEVALRAGASAVVSESTSDAACAVPWFRVQDALRVLGHIASRFAAEPSKRLEISAFCGDSQRSELRRAAALIHVRDDGALVEARIARDARHLGSAELHRKLAVHAAGQGRSVLLECRPSDLVCGRLEGVRLSAAVVGLAENAAAEEVATAASLLRRLPHDAVAILEADSPFTPHLAACTSALVISWGFHPSADVRATLLRRDRNGVALHVQTPVGGCELELAALDELSQRAALAALTHATCVGVAPERAAARLARRCSSTEAVERMPLPLGFDVWMTRARTRDALGRALRTVVPFTPGRVLLVPPGGDEREQRIHDTLDAAAHSDGILIVSADNGSADRAAVREWFLRGLMDAA